MPLPSLHNLRLDPKPTGTNPEKRQLLAPSSGEPIPWVDVPQELIDLVAGALADTTRSPGAICGDIKAWCLVNKQACLDGDSDVYRFAIRAFGYLPPTSTSYRGGFLDWRDLFVALCQVFTEFRTPEDTAQLAKGGNAGYQIWSGLAYHLDLRVKAEMPFPALRQVVRRLLRQEPLGPRDLDEFERALIEAYVAGGGRPSQKLVRRQFIEDAFARDVVTVSPNWEPWQGVALPDEPTAQWRALWWLLRQKGAGARPDGYWEQKDTRLCKLYAECIEQSETLRDELLLKRDGTWERNKAEIYRLIGYGADAFQQGVLWPSVLVLHLPDYLYAEPWGPPMTVFELAHRTHNEALLNLLYTVENPFSRSRDPRFVRDLERVLQSYVRSAQAGEEAVSRYMNQAFGVISHLEGQLKKFAVARDDQLVLDEPHITLSNIDNMGTKLIRSAERVFELLKAGAEGRNQRQETTDMLLEQTATLRLGWFDVLRQVDQIDYERRVALQTQWGSTLPDAATAEELAQMDQSYPDWKQLSAEAKDLLLQRTRNTAVARQ